MRLKQLADVALTTFPATSVERGQVLADEIKETSLTIRIDDGRQVHSVVWDFSAASSRAACTCGSASCEHAAAVLAWLSGQDRGRASMIPAASPGEDQGPADSREELEPAPEESLAELGQAVTALVQSTWRRGLTGESSERDRALKHLVEQLRRVDAPEVKRLVAILRRHILSTSPDKAEMAHTLVTLNQWAQQLRPGREGPTDRRQRTEWKQEMRLFEVARDSQRTPYGDRREVSYFLDLDEGDLYRELATSQREGEAPVFSEGPFPKRLLGNLVEVQQGPRPRRIRMLQYASAGFATASDLERIRGVSTREVSGLYGSYRRAVQERHDYVEQFVIFAPRRVFATATGIILADDHGGLLPLARRQTPSLCTALDHMAHEATLVVVAGILVPAANFFSLLPLSAVVSSGNRLRLRRIR